MDALPTASTQWSLARMRLQKRYVWGSDIEDDMLLFSVKKKTHLFTDQKKQTNKIHRKLNVTRLLWARFSPFKPGCKNDWTETGWRQWLPTCYFVLTNQTSSVRKSYTRPATVLRETPARRQHHVRQHLFVSVSSQRHILFSLVYYLNEWTFFFFLLSEIERTSAKGDVNRGPSFKRVRAEPRPFPSNTFA